MRRTRRLILALIAVLVAGVSVIYTLQKQTQARQAPQRPANLPKSVSALAREWEWENTRDGKPHVRVRARNFVHNAQSNRVDLTGVELQLFQKDGKSFDRVRSEKADFDLNASQMFSEGEVEITMAVPADQPAANATQSGRLMTIRTSGVHFDNKTGRAWTERPAAFVFDRGRGECVGAEYNPELRELQMRTAVKLDWHGDDPKSPPRHVEAGNLVYKETVGEVWLTPWSKFRRETLSMDGGNALVRLDNGAIRTVDAIAARGVDQRPQRTLEYAAETMNLRFGPNHVVEHVNGSRNARLVSTSATSNTSVQSDTIDLEFVTSKEDSVLQRARASGAARVESKPVVRAGVPPPDTRLLTSNAVLLHMREGGEEVDRIEADSPGHLEFLPNRPDGRKRVVDGNQMTLHYGAANQIKTFTATDVNTRTEPLPGRKAPPATTSSKGMTAHFDEKTGLMTLLEQWDNFRWQEGDRRARSNRAEFRQSAEQVLLTGRARVEDPTGSTDAEKITLHQKSGDFEAEGSVASTRLQDRKKGTTTTGTAMLSGDAPVQAKADSMRATGDNTLVVYQGKALMWQDADRISADVIRIDRKANRLFASGQVETRLLDKSAAKVKTSGGAKPLPAFTIVRAPEFEYDDKTRLAHYRGGATLTQQGTVVTAREIRAWLAPEGAKGSSLERAFADGDVKIVQTAPDRNRTGTSEHGEYYPNEEKVLLSGGKPVFRDSVKGTTTGRVITFYSAQDRVEVEGEAQQPVETRILRRKKS